MSKLFGIPVNSMLAGLLIALAAGVLIMVVTALRNPVFFKMGVRNITRRPAQTSLIVLGLMLTTLLICAALVTGDTMNNSIRQTALKMFGPVDEVVQGKGAHTEADQMAGGGRAQENAIFFGPDMVARVNQSLAGSGLTDGITPIITGQAPATSPASRQNLPSITFLGVENDYAAQTEPLTAADGSTLDVASLTNSEAFINSEAADKLDAAAGDTIQIFINGRPASLRVAGIFSGGGKPSQGPALVMPVAGLQSLMGKPGSYNMILVSNTGGPFDGAANTGAVTAKLDPALDGTSLETRPVKQKAISDAETAANTFSSIFLLFGEFSMIAGIMLIFLIFVMLAAERKTELGVMRALGARRRDILKVFAFEGVVYSAAAALVGVLGGVVVGWAMVKIIACAFGNLGDAAEGFSISYSFSPRSMVIAYAMGMIATFVVVLISAWRAGHINIVRAIRDLPEPRKHGRRRRWVIGTVVLLVLGVLLTAAGIGSNQAAVFMIGTTFLIVGVPFLARTFGLPDRAVFSIAGIGMLLWWLLPERVVHKLLPFLPENMNAGMEMFIISGIAIVAGAIWTVMYNSDILLRLVVAVFGRFKGLPSILKIAVNYPMRNRFRTGMALAMFSLIIFTMVFMSAMLLAFSSLYEDYPKITGGFQIQGQTGYSNPVTDLEGTLASRGDGVGPGDFAAIGSMSTAAVDLRQKDAGTGWSRYVVQGADAGYTRNITYKFISKAPGYGSDADIWKAVQDQPGLAVVHTSLVPSRSNYNAGAPASQFKLSGFYSDDKEMPDNIFIEVRDPVSGKVSQLRVIGVIEDTAIYANMSIFTSQQTLAGLTASPAPPTTYWFKVNPSVNVEDASRGLARTFYENGMNTKVLEDEIRNMMAVNTMMNRLLTGFMGLGLVVGIAALGVIAARSVVERRQQIGMLRAIGFRRGMVQGTFLLESSFVALLGITIGTALGLGLSYSVMDFMSQNVQGISYQAPWGNIIFIGLLAYFASLLTTFLPARQAARIYPAEALRYE